MKSFPVVLLLSAAACTPLHDRDPNYTYQSRQDAFFDGCKSGHDCENPLNDPSLHPKVNTVVVPNQ